jgi:cysteinyl-tRNA synthetase
MALSFYNTMTRSVEPFRPITEGEVKLYTCGPTVYNNAHIGNFRTYTFEDVLRRYLEYKGFRVTQVMNITDVEDKIIKKTRAENKSLQEVVEPYIQAFFEDIDTLNIERAEHYPRATEYVEGMVKMAQDLLDKGFAYRSEDGSIYYSISKFPNYGKLAHINVDELVAGARVKQDEYEKETASDFALWKAYDENDGTVSWETPLGKGRPGWHLECSTMSTALLGNHFDIHTGGEDNIFPHHENEIAQSEATTGQKFVNYWLHSRHLLVDETKMSKSKKNFFTARELFDSGTKWYALRYLYISSHYRSLLNFSLEGLAAQQEAVEGLYSLMRRLGERVREGGNTADSTPAISEACEKARLEFEAGMDDDLNTARALAALHTLKDLANKGLHEGTLSGGDAQNIADLFVKCDKVLGLKLEEQMRPPDLDAEIQKLVDERQEARKRKDFKRSDELRDQLKSQGIMLEDTAAGVRWKRV